MVINPSTYVQLRNVVVDPQSIQLIPNKLATAKRLVDDQRAQAQAPLHWHSTQLARRICSLE